MIVIGKRKNPWVTIGYSNYEGFHLMPFDWRKRGETHELNRERVVSLILLELYVMAASGIIPKDRMIGVQRFPSQNLRDSQKEMSEPARCAPRQVGIGDKTMTELLMTKFRERAYDVSAFFTETDLLPANYNRADTLAEGNGLSNGFRDACRFVVADAHYQGKLIHLNTAISVRRAYSIYKDQAWDAYRISCDRLGDKLRFNIAKQDMVSWNEQLKISRVYQSALQNSPGASVVLDFEHVNGLIKIYKDFLKK